MEEVPHPLDDQYEMLKCGLKLVPKKDKEFKLLNEYMVNTGSSDRWYNLKLTNLWKVDRENEVCEYIFYCVVFV